MFNLSIMSNVASILGLGVYDVLKILDSIGNKFESEREKRIKSFLNDLSLRMKFSEEIINNGYQDQILEKYYKNDKSEKFQMYTSMVGGVNKCGFAFYKPFFEIFSNGFCRLSNENISFRLSRNWTPKNLRCDEKDEANAILNLDKEQNTVFSRYCQLEALLSQNIKIWDSPIFVLKRIDIKNKLFVFDLSLNSYINHRFNFGQIQDELLKFISEELKNNTTIDKIIDNLFVNSRLYKRDSYGKTLNDFSNFKERSIPVGINVLVALRRPKDYLLIIQNRARRVAENPGGLAVIPTAIHQPCIDALAEKSIISTMWREIYEELFGGEESERQSSHIIHDWYLKESDAMNEIINSADIYLLGFGLNLLNGFLDFSILLKVNTENILKSHSHKLKTNWEISESGAPTFSSKDRSAIAKVLRSKEWVPISRFTFEKGLIALCDTDQSRCLDIRKI